MLQTKLKFVKTCSACPEQYNVFLGDQQVGYVRLRWGTLRVDFPSHQHESGSKTIYRHYFEDSMKGCFDDKKEYLKYRGYISKAIHKALRIKSIK